jgi:hypothetical protein
MRRRGHGQPRICLCRYGCSRVYGQSWALIKLRDQVEGGRVQGQAKEALREGAGGNFGKNGHAAGQAPGAKLEEGDAMLPANGLGPEIVEVVIQLVGDKGWRTTVEAQHLGHGLLP